MRKREKQSTLYRASVAGSKGIMRFLVYILLGILLVYVSKQAYQFGYLVFSQKPVASSAEDGEDIEVTIREEDSIQQIGQKLKSLGLIRNDEVFWMQEFLSDYKGMIVPGTYILNTSQTVEEMFAIMARENTEGQPEQEDEAEAQEGSGT